MQAAPCEDWRSLQDTATAGTVNATTSGTIRARINLPWSQTRVMLMRTYHRRQKIRSARGDFQHLREKTGEQC